ncbi:reverse transcriptase domain, Reverse transcriptase zinc-binding domain protein [Artemisia annua]|uniref:Reverse transcriptase domain, Reverse transcriptase zinc-binding domain protein n=1 Tax=Artemisia annua TaxID=35608 RepID=A0A2U1QMJ3_ARTAN|nr:reverse transcriptase domain, Reverse transcriptase zinc-binding domain protein [Artemisia annua]
MENPTDNQRHTPVQTHDGPQPNSENPFQSNEETNNNGSHPITETNNDMINREKRERFRSKRLDGYEVKLPPSIDHAWGWRKLLAIRPKVHPFIRHTINHGKSTSVWFDMWYDISPLRDMLTPRDISRAGLTLLDSVSNVNENGTWRWLADWYYRFSDIVNLSVPDLLDDSDDEVLWQDLDGNLRPFLVAFAWDSLHDRLWESDVGPNVDLSLLKCPLCEMVWLKVQALSGMDAIPPSLEDVITFLMLLSKGRSVVSFLSRLFLAASTYYIWMEQNSRHFNRKQANVDEVLKLVTFKFNRLTFRVREMLNKWKIPSACYIHEEANFLVALLPSCLCVDVGRSLDSSPVDLNAYELAPVKPQQQVGSSQPSQPPPPESQKGNMDLSLGVLGEWLSVLCNYHESRADVWTMKTYGVKDSWTKLVSIPCQTDLGMHYISMPLCISNDGKVLLRRLFKWFVYDCTNSSWSEIQNFGRFQSRTVVESLVSPFPALDHPDNNNGDS